MDYLGRLAGGRLMVSAAAGTGEAAGRRGLKRAPSSVRMWGVKQRKPTSQSAFRKLVAGIGFEPMTFRL